MPAKLVAGRKAAVEGLFQLFVETVLERLSKIEAALAGPLQGTAKESTAGGGAEDGDGGPA